MAYIGRGIDNLSNIEVLDVITFTDSAGPYNILKGGVAFIPSATQNLLIEVDGIIQASASYTTTGSTITFGVSMASSSVMNSFLHLATGLITTPGDGTVSSVKIVDDAVTTAKILDNNVTVAKLPTTLDISGNTVTLPASVSGLGTGINVTTQITGVVPSANLGSGTGSSANFLRGDSSWQEVATGTSWQSVVTASTLTAVAGNGYPINTTSNACTVTLPASASVGDTIEFTDYLRTWATNNVTINPNSLKFQGRTTPQPVYDTDGQSVKIVYMDVTQGWIPISDDDVTNETDPTYDIDFVVVAGGGGGGSGGNGSWTGAGGGAGGFRTYTKTGLAAGVVITATVGTGGAGGVTKYVGGDGVNSSISGSGLTTTTSTGGGGGGGQLSNSGDGADGGSGGGATSQSTSPGAGNAGGYDPVEGFIGGSAVDTSRRTGGGGGGRNAAGEDAKLGAGGMDCTVDGSDGGVGISNSITGSAVFYAGGGGSGVIDSSPVSMTPGAGGNGGGGAGGIVNSIGDVSAGSPGTANTGGGGGGGACDCGSEDSDGGAGGSGVIILSVPDASYSGTVTGSPDVTTGVSGKTIIKFTGTGSYTS